MTSATALSDAEGPTTRAGPRALSLALRLYIAFATFTLPMDWFDLTGDLLREFGAKPATLVLTIGGLCGLLISRRDNLRKNGMEVTVGAVFSAWLALGMGATLLNFMLGWSGWDFTRDPLFQLMSQSLMVIVCGLALIGNIRLLQGRDVVPYLARVLPVAVLFHLVIFLADASGLINDDSGPLALFRVENGEMERPTGLFSEPSYFGTFAALFGTALLCIRTTLGKRVLNVLLALSLYTGAVLIGAKTFVVVAGAQTVMLMLRRRDNGRRNPAAILLFCAVAACAVLFVQTQSALDVEENLSSTMRIGSSALAANVAGAGYGLTGVGLGQFHFFYTDEFAPSFIFLSREALSQLSSEVDNRASTFNLYLRVIVEIGVLGLLLLAVCLYKLWFARIPDSMAFVSVIFAGALGFLMTQDTYFYPPLVLSSALLIAIIHDSRRDVGAVAVDRA